jgi:hypothetical protein
MNDNLRMQNGHALTRAEFETEIDVALAGSFPASDPPPWTFGALEPEFVTAAASVPAVRPPNVTFPMAGVPAAIDVVIAAGHGGRTRRRLWTIAEAVGLAALMPAGMLLAAVPVLLVLWIIAVAFGWFSGPG